MVDLSGRDEEFFGGVSGVGGFKIGLMAMLSYVHMYVGAARVREHSESNPVKRDRAPLPQCNRQACALRGIVMSQYRLYLLASAHA